MNDNRAQVGNGATVQGSNLGNQRDKLNHSRKGKPDVASTYNLNEDGVLEYRDFLLLIRAMKSNPAAKNQMLYEIAGFPNLRGLVE